MGGCTAHCMRECRGLISSHEQAACAWLALDEMIENPTSSILSTSQAIFSIGNVKLRRTADILFVEMCNMSSSPLPACSRWEAVPIPIGEWHHICLSQVNRGADIVLVADAVPLLAASGTAAQVFFWGPYYGDNPASFGSQIGPFDGRPVPSAPNGAASCPGLTLPLQNFGARAVGWRVHHGGRHTRCIQAEPVEPSGPRHANGGLCCGDERRPQDHLQQLLQQHP